MCTSSLKSHRNIYHCMAMLSWSHSSPGVLEKGSITNKRPPQGPLGYSPCCGCTKLVSDQRREHFLSHPAEMFSLWPNFRHIYHPILRLGFVRAEDHKGAPRLNKRALSSSNGFQWKLLSKEQLENRAVKALTAAYSSSRFCFTDFFWLRFIGLSN